MHQNTDSNKICQKCGDKLLLKGRYQAIKLIAQGGFGKTFLAVDNSKASQPYCVIKQLLPSAQKNDDIQKASELFATEAIRLDNLGSHPQIPKLLDYLTHEDDRQYLIQEYIEGQNLEQELKLNGAFNQEQIRILLLDVLPVLQFIHSQEVIHRDIKPENIIRRASDNRAFLVDFGAAKLVTPLNRSVTGTVIGSAEYVAPEQASGKTTKASDLYSLGVTCIHLLTDISPFDLFDIGEYKWVWREYLVNNPVSEQLGYILDKMIQFGLKKRYATASEILEDLQSDRSFQARKTAVNIYISPPQTPAKGGIFNWFQSNAPKQSLSRQPYIETLPSGITLDMVAIGAGKFLMGSAYGFGEPSQYPQHIVNVAAFYMGKYPVTQEQWQIIMGNNPAKFKGSKNPVEYVNWYGALQFCQILSQLTGRQYRLPSEAEWEYACRGGTQTHYYFGNDERQLGEYAWYGSNSNHQTHPVGQKQPNQWGLYDMHGNVWEWCLDDWHYDYHGAPNDGQAWFDDINSQQGIQRVDVDGQPVFYYDLAVIKANNHNSQLLRGGSWYLSAQGCRAAERNSYLPDDFNRYIGFRLACAG